MAEWKLIIAHGEIQATHIVGYFCLWFEATERAALCTVAAGWDVWSLARWHKQGQRWCDVILRDLHHVAPVFSGREKDKDESDVMQKCVLWWFVGNTGVAWSWTMHSYIDFTYVNIIHLQSSHSNVRGLSKKYPTLGQEKIVLYLGGYNT